MKESHRLTDNSGLFGLQSTLFTTAAARCPLQHGAIVIGLQCSNKSQQVNRWLTDNCNHFCTTDRPSNRCPSFLPTEQLSNHHGSTLPPVPPPHRQQPSITALNHSLSSAHHAGQSLNLTRQLTPPTGSPAPVAGQSPVELQTTPPESVPLQDSWVLGSNVPLETR